MSYTSSTSLLGYAGGTAEPSIGSISNTNGTISATAVPSSIYTGGGSSNKTKVAQSSGLATPTLIGCILVIGIILYFASKR